MNRSDFSRRELLRRGGYCLGASLAVERLAAATEAAVAAPTSAPASFPRYCLNTGTIRGQKLSLIDEVKIAAAAGYDAIEPWMSEIHAFVKQGGSLPELKRHIADLGLSVESAIGMNEWIAESSERSPQGIEAWKGDFDLLARLGGRRICAPPCGKISPDDRDLQRIAARYRRLLELGRTFGVAPQLELWGRAAAISRLGEVAYVLAEAGSPYAGAVLDVFHIYTGGSPPAGLRAFSAESLHVFHLNDYPGEPPRDRIADSARVYPGNGVAPLTEILCGLQAIGFHGFLSLELFNESYWRESAETVARVGLEKMRDVVRKCP